MKIIAVASGGGHWMQLMRLRPAFNGHEVFYITTKYGNANAVANRVYRVIDANSSQKFKFLVMSVQIFLLLLLVRPNIVVTTGAALGVPAVILGKFFGSRTIWIDSIANSESMSLSGRWTSSWSDAWITQWESVAKSEGAKFWGRIL